jgi:hypothetical protein
MAGLRVGMLNALKMPEIELLRFISYAFPLCFKRHIRKIAQHPFAALFIHVMVPKPGLEPGRA